MTVTAALIRRDDFERDRPETLEARDARMKDALPREVWRDARWLEINGRLIEAALADGDCETALVRVRTLTDRLDRIEGYAIGAKWESPA
jgi:hypothetical protein